MPSDFLHKGENTSHYGSNDQIASELSITRNLEGDQTERGTITYHQAGEYDAVVALIPKLGSTSQYFKNGAVLQTVQLSSEPSNVWKVVLTYYNPSVDESSIEAGGRAKDFQLSVSTESRCILLHKDFFDGSASKISEPALFYLNKLINGGSPTDLVYPPAEDSNDLSSDGSKIDTSADKITIEQAVSKCGDELATKAFNFIKAGVVSYLSTHVCWSETEYSTAKPTSTRLGNVGKIASPSQAPSFNGRNWLLTDVSTSASKNDEYWKTTWTYTLSDEGSQWNSDLYS